MNASPPAADPTLTPEAALPSPVPAALDSSLPAPSFAPKSKTNALAVTQDQMSKVLGTVETLTQAELMEYQRCECMVQAGWDGAVDAGAALLQIRDQRLYRCEYSDFKVYCRNRWQLPATTVQSLISAAHCVDAIRQVKGILLPQHESQLRPVFGLAPDQVRTVWQAAVSKSGGRPITARIVQRVVQELYPPPPKPRPAVKKSEQRQLVKASLNDLLGLLHRRAEYSEIIQEAELLYSRFQALIAPSRPVAAEQSRVT